MPENALGLACYVTSDGSGRMVPLYYFIYNIKYGMADVKSDSLKDHWLQ